jgi:hypothetical protein
MKQPKGKKVHKMGSPFFLKMSWCSHVLTKEYFNLVCVINVLLPLTSNGLLSSHANLEVDFQIKLLAPLL